MAKVVSIFGTSSDAGKSTIALILGRIFQDIGYKVAPFKAQNVSNNSQVADDGSEIAYSQYFQALALQESTSWSNNPILLKSGGANRSHLILRGRALGVESVKSYYKNIHKLKPIVKEAISNLKRDYEVIIAEGAGSPVELNLMSKDLSNIFVAKEYNSKIILVADIEKGGVFASIYGVYHLLPKELQKNVVGVIVNKFRGDLSLFDDGVKIIEEEFGIPLLGVLPYFDFNLGFEDSQSLKNYTQPKLKRDAKRVAVIAYPTMSNYNDFEPLIVRDDINVEFISWGVSSLDSYDLVILGGSKLVMKDLRWLKEVGLFEKIKSRRGEILGICGGYEMMFERLIDECGVEGDTLQESGFGFIKDDIHFQKEKIVKKGKYQIFGRVVEGFEIHNGTSKKYPLSYQKDNIKGTFVHGIFEDKKFRQYQRDKIDELVEKSRKYLDINRLKSIIF